MFQRILIADDLESINQGIFSTIAQYGSSELTQVNYCDDAYLKLKKSQMDGCQYDLLITDLSFAADHRKQRLTSGVDLIKAVRDEFENIKIIAYSIEDRPFVIRQLIDQLKVDAYVCKSRHGLMELGQAVKSVSEGNNYVSPQIRGLKKPRETNELTAWDVELLRHLAMGHSQTEISNIFKQQQLRPSSLSAIEKQLNRLKDRFKANNVVHLVAIVKDLGII